MSVAAIQIDGISKRYGYHRALAGVSFELRAGSLCALLGPNGAGKSTLLGILSTLVRPTAGAITYRPASGEAPSAKDVGKGTLPLARSDLSREIGVLAHSSFIYGELTGMENLLFYSRLYGIADAGARANALLDEVGLEPQARDRQARTYSRGMLQRVALARAMLHDPGILLLDEPFTGLDRTGAAALARVLADAKVRGRIVLVITHDLEAISGLTDHVVVLRRGKVAFEERREQALGRTEVVGFSYDDLKTIYHQHTE